MSDVSDAAVVRLILADYAVLDGGGKLNLIGGGLSVIGQQVPVGSVVASGFTAPFYVALIVSVSPDLIGAEAALELALEDDNGQPVPMPGPTGEPQLLRVAQNVTFQVQDLSNIGVPGKVTPAKVQWVLAFTNGLPLALGKRYTWRVRLDGNTRDDWTESFFVPGPPPVVIG